jgi:Domain of unknown function (DUF4350)
MTSPFSRTAVVALVAGTLLSIGLAGILTAFGDDLSDPVSASADSYSKSAIGHRGLVRLLERLDIPVVVSRSESARADNGLLVVAEPIITDDASRTRLERLIASGRKTLVVLPKWHGFAQPHEPWLEHATYVPAQEVDDVLKVIDYDMQTSDVVRLGAPPTWVFADDNAPEPDLAAPQLIHTTTIGRAIGDRQHNILLGTRERTFNLVYVLTDPDVLNNQGLRRPANARFMVKLIDGLRDGGPVIIDETMHGYTRPPSVMRTLLAFPLVVVTVQIIACAILLVWAAMVRFGPRRAAPPPIAPGKDFLIRNTAALLHYGGHHADAVRRYLQLTVADVRHALHAPAAATTTWLDDVRRSRGGTISLAELERAAASETHPRNLVALADRIYRWRMEMTHGLDRGT